MIGKGSCIEWRGNLERKNWIASWLVFEVMRNGFHFQKHRFATIDWLQSNLRSRVWWICLSEKVPRIHGPMPNQTQTADRVLDVVTKRLKFFYSLIYAGCTKSLYSLGERAILGISCIPLCQILSAEYSNVFSVMQGLDRTAQYHRVMCPCLFGSHHSMSTDVIIWKNQPNVKWGVHTVIQPLYII